MGWLFQGTNYQDPLCVDFTGTIQESHQVGGVYGCSDEDEQS